MEADRPAREPDENLPTPIIALDPIITSSGITCVEMGCFDRATHFIEDVDGDSDPLCPWHLIDALWGEIGAQRADLAAFVAAEASEPLRGHTLTPRRREQVERMLAEHRTNPTGEVPHG